MTGNRGRIEGKVAIVTGAGSSPGPGVGVGKAISVVLAREGACVLLVDREPDRAQETLTMIESDGGRARVFGGDVTKAVDCRDMVADAVDAFGRLDVLVNNVAISPPLGSVEDIAEDVWDRTLEINLKSVFLTCKHAIPVMASNGGGSIVNIGSISALRGAGQPTYAAAKGGMVALTRDMAYRNGRQGIRVNVVLPGHIRTPMVDMALHGADESVHTMRLEATPLGTEGTAWDVAWATLFLASDEARWITGVSLPVDAGVLITTPLSMRQYMR